MSARRGSPSIERLPSARGPHSMRPWNQPTTRPSANRARGGLHQLSVIVKNLHGAAFTFDGGTMFDEEGGEFSVAERRAPKSVSYFRSSSAGLMPHRVGGADRSAGVAGRRLQIAFLKAGAVGDLTVGHRIVRAAAGERDGTVAIAPLQRVQQMEKGVLVNCLSGKCQIAVTVLDRCVRLARRAELLDKRLREQSPTHRFATRPLVADIFGVMAKVFEVQNKTAIILQ